MKKILLLLFVLFSFNSFFAQVTATFNVTPITCTVPTGVIMINPTGGVAPFQFSINNGINFQPNNIFVGLLPGAYNVVVKDNTGAVLNLFIPISPVIPPALTTLVTNPTCNGDANGEIATAVSGGQAPFTYTLHSGGAVVGPVSFSVFAGLTAGSYSVEVKDANGCITTSPIIMVTEPAALSCTSVSNSNSITVSATGGSAPYTYSIDGVSYTSSGVFGPLSPGNYTVQVRDTHGCICASPTTIINSGFSANITSSLDTPTSTLTANVTGGTGPYTYQWGLNGTTIDGEVNQTLNILGMWGTFTLNVTDANNLTATAIINVVNLPIYANDDVFTIYPINVGNAVSSTSVLSNDFLNGMPVNSPGNTVILTALVVPAGFLLNANGTVSVLPGTPSGTYTLTYQICSVAHPGYCDPGAVTITVTNSGIRLNAFVDSNNNGVKDLGELAFTHGQFGYEVNNSGTVHYVTSYNGEYFINESNSANSYHLTYSIDSAFAAQYSLTTASYSNVTVPSGVVVYDFPVTELPFNDLTVNVYQSGAPPRPGFVYTDGVIYKNNGNQTIVSGTVTFTKDNTVAITNVSQSGITNTPTGFTYDFTNLLPGEARYIYITMQVPAIPMVALGQTLTNAASVTIPVGDINVSNNNNSLTQIIVGSYDPNEITESHGEKIVYSTFTSNDYLTYTIQFENTGTDNAENVHVNDILDAKLDETSIKMLDASHDYTLNRVGNNLNWNFNGIDLPASGGKGYIHFQVKPKAGYAVGDIIPNTANIYFDFNPAIVTNTFNTEFVSALSAAQFASTSFVAYPNPTNGQFTISLKNNANTIDTFAVLDVLGKTVQTNVIHNSTAVIDLSNLSRGIYFVKVKSEGEEKVIKIVKE